MTSEQKILSEPATARHHRTVWWKEALIIGTFYSLYTLIRNQFGSQLVNGVDILRWNDQGRVTEFKVMVRPLKAMQAIHQRMGEMLQQMQGQR